MLFFFSSRRRHTRYWRDWSSDVCSSDLWTTLTAILFIGLNLMGSPIWAAERFEPAKAGAVPVEVTGMQFAWYFRYAGADGKFGATKPDLIDPSSGNEAAIGLEIGRAHV